MNNQINLSVEIIGRNIEEKYGVDIDKLALANLNSTVEIFCQGDALYDIKAELFENMSNGSTGGIVIRVTCNKLDPGYLPFAKNIENGIELHVGGAQEGADFLQAITALIGRKSRMADLLVGQGILDAGKHDSDYRGRVKKMYSQFTESGLEDMLIEHGILKKEE